MVSSTLDLVTSLALKAWGSSSTSPSRLPRMLVENQPSRPSMRALSAGRDDGLHHRLAALEVTAGDRHALLRASSCSAGVSTLTLGVALAKGTPSLRAA